MEKLVTSVCALCKGRRNKGGEKVDIAPSPGVDQGINFAPNLSGQLEFPGPFSSVSSKSE